uniref:40S ribosomal protein S15-like n=1 Tax=Macaca mulatta TaxID=9544 RepID=UPI0010A20009|nr:40S ribosomal protein S15-like [Macaca mulatta]
MGYRGPGSESEELVCLSLVISPSCCAEFGAAHLGGTAKLGIIRMISQDGRSGAEKAAKQKQQTFCKFTSCGVHPDLLRDLSREQRMKLHCGLWQNQHSLLKGLCKVKKWALPMQKPEVVNAHLQDMIILPQMGDKMVDSMVGVYNGKAFNQVEGKPERIGHYLDHLQACEALPGQASEPPTLPVSPPSRSLLSQ